jgi:hypothetical protein
VTVLELGGGDQDDQGQDGYREVVIVRGDDIVELTRPYPLSIRRVRHPRLIPRSRHVTSTTPTTWTNGANPRVRRSPRLSSALRWLSGSAAAVA